MYGLKRSMDTAARVSLAYACALVTVLALFLPPGGYGRMLEGKYACFLFLTIGYLIMLGLTLPLPDRASILSHITLLHFAASAFLLFSGISAVLSPYGVQTLLGGARREGLLTICLYVFCCLVLSVTLRADRLLPMLTAISVLLCDSLVMVQLAGFNPLNLYPAGLGYWDGDIAYPGFYAGTAGNIDFTAFLLALSVSILAASAVRGTGRVRFLLILPILLTLYTLFRMGVAAAWAGLAAAMIWGLALLFPERRLVMLLCSAVLTATALLLLRGYTGSNGTLSEAAQLLHGEWNGSFGSGRLDIWQNCLALVRESPIFGGGPDTLYLRNVASLTWQHDGTAVPADITAAHNEYLNILVNQGALALSAYLLLLGGALFRCFRHAAEPRMAICGVGLLCYAVMAVFSISTCITAPYIWLLLAVALSKGDA